MQQLHPCGSRRISSVAPGADFFPDPLGAATHAMLATLPIFSPRVTRLVAFCRKQHLACLASHRNMYSCGRSKAQCEYGTIVAPLRGDAVHDGIVTLKALLAARCLPTRCLPTRCPKRSRLDARPGLAARRCVFPGVSQRPSGPGTSRPTPRIANAIGSSYWREWCRSGHKRGRGGRTSLARRRAGTLSESTKSAWRTDFRFSRGRS